MGLFKTSTDNSGTKFTLLNVMTNEIKNNYIKKTVKGN